MTVEEILNCSFSERKKSHHDAGMAFKKHIRGPMPISSALAKPNTDTGKKAIYIHVPYCKKICSFCSMRRSINPVPDDYAELVVKQIKKYGKTEYVQSSVINSVYFGGGTPTALPSEQLAKILQALYNNFNIADDAEISVETTLTELDGENEKLKTLFDNSVNRLSIGVQTFDNSGREQLGRLGTGEFAEEIIKKAFTTGFRNVNIDIIYNYMNETKEMLQKDIQRAAALDIAGFSFYSLIVMGKTKIGSKIDKESYTKKTVESDAMFFSTAVTEARKNGYDFLEITKLVKPNRDNYEYIRTSHQAGDVFPVGAGAGGNINSTAFMIPLKKQDFQNHVDNFGKLQGMSINPAYKRIKKFSGLMQEGIIEIPLLTEDEHKKIEAKLDTFKAEGLVQNKNGIFKFTDKGFFWGNNIASEIIKTIYQ
ncbi:MAG: radical SAM protein [Treponema sp.]|nr:MAG: radical SAM protein [Treponema sp.]